MDKSKTAMKIEQETKDVKYICETLVGEVKHQISNGIEQVDTKEMSEVIDMIKDLSEAKEKIIKACYYEQIMEAMEESEYGEDYDEDGPMERKFYRGQPRSKTSGRYMRRGDGRRRGYEETMGYEEVYPLRDMDRETMGRMYYSGGNSSSGMSSGSSSGGSMASGSSRNYSERDMREGRSGQSRRSYMESKEMNKGNSAEEKQHKMKELDKYMKELSEDITEMISDSSPEEKSMLKSKMQTLMQKI